METCTADTTRSGTASTGAWRHLALTSTALAHGTRSRASVFFSENGSSTPGVATNVDQPNSNGLDPHSAGAGR